MYFSESNKNKCYKQPHSDKRKSTNTEKSETIQVMEFWKRNFDKLKPTALSQKTNSICCKQSKMHAEQG